MKKGENPITVLVMYINNSTKPGGKAVSYRRLSYVDYDYETFFNKSIETASDALIKQMLSDGKIKSVYATKTIQSGNQFEVEIYPEFTKRERGDFKLERVNKAQRNLNDKNARKRLERLINTNFSDGDYWITLTYEPGKEPKDIDDALKNIRNYIKRINYRRKKENIGKAKYIYVTEYAAKGKKIRCHHHLIMDSALPMDMIEKLWDKGRRNNIRRTATDECGLSGLAQYLSKDPNGNKRWCASTNLKRPKEHKSYSRIKSSHVKKMVEGKLNIKEFAERQYKNKIYLYEDIRYNEFNSRFYIYIRMRDADRNDFKNKKE